MIAVLITICVTTARPAIVEFELGNPAGLKRANDAIKNRVTKSAAEHKKFIDFEKRYQDYKRRANIAFQKVDLIGSIKNDDERREYAAEVIKELQAIKKEGLEFDKELADLAKGKPLVLPKDFPKK